MTPTEPIISRDASDTAPPCKGKPNISDHAMLELGNCAHQVGGATYTYKEFGCLECGVTGRQTVIFACGTGRKRVAPIADNCLALAWKKARQ